MLLYQDITSICGWQGDEHEDGRPAFRAYCPPLESIGASTWGDTNIGEVLHMIVDELAEETSEVVCQHPISQTIHGFFHTFRQQ